jgi:hypothetical protein
MIDIWQMKFAKIRPFVLSLLIFLAACNPLTTSVSMVITPVQTPLELLLASPTPGVQTTLTPAGVLEPTPTFSITAEGVGQQGLPCVPVQSAVTFSAPMRFEEYPRAILEYLNEGGPPLSLETELNRAGVASKPIAVAAADMTGDVKTDVVVSIFDPVSKLSPPAGILYIFTCQEDAYVVSLGLQIENMGAPIIHALQDMNADGSAELVTGLPQCDEIMCFEQVQIIFWNGETFENRLDGETEDLPYPNITVKIQRDGSYQLKIDSESSGNQGAGLTRRLSRQWDYNKASGYWVFAKEIKAASNYRLHVLQDADLAAQSGDYTSALPLYNRVINDQSLQEYLDADSERPNLQAYARYRMAVIYIKLNQTTFASSILDEMKRTVLPESPQIFYLKMAEEYQRIYQSSGEEAACQAVQAFAADNSTKVLDPLGSKIYGSANPDYTPEAMCP